MKIAIFASSLVTLLLYLTVMLEGSELPPVYAAIIFTVSMALFYIFQTGDDNE